VGYTIRFEDASDKQRTRIKYMTDGMLFREYVHEIMKLYKTWDPDSLQNDGGSSLEQV
jgi:HrpA-like RNA helicase